MKSKLPKKLEIRRMQAEASLALTRVRRRTERRVAELLQAQSLDVTPAQANAMMVLFQAREPITARHLADELALSEVTVGRFVKALDSGGWMQRQRDPSDNRAMLLTPTRKAYEALPRFIAVSNTMLGETFAGFSRAEIEDYLSVVDRVRRNLGC